MTCGGWLHRTESRGYVRARSADPFAPPVIQPNYLAHELDQRGALAALRVARRILRSAPLSPYYDGEKTPGEEIEGDDENCSPTGGKAARRAITPWAPAEWAGTTIRVRWWTPSCGCTAWRACASSTLR